MEINPIKDQLTNPPSEMRGKRSTSGQSVEKHQISPSQDPNVRTSHVYKYFPKGQQIKRSPRIIMSSRTSVGNSNSSLVLIHPKLPLYTERTMNVYMPRLTFNHIADANLKIRRSHPSPSVTNNKMCMKKKGLNINDLYSFRHRHRTIKSGESYNLQMFNQNDTDQADIFKRRSTIATQFKTSGDFERDIAKEFKIDSPVFVRLMTGLEREAKIPGHIRPEDSNGNILGKVISKAHQHCLLTQKEPVIPAVFYYK